MRRLLTMLMILLVVIVAGLSALVMLVNPNDFRDYLIGKVASRSGYQLKLEGRLRWHVWPQLSILSGRMSLTEPGASAPLVRADNMRLDVALLPLLSHQLKVKQVMLKGAVIELTPQTEAVKDRAAPVAPRENSLSLEGVERGWSFDVAKLKVNDSLLVFQHEGDEQITVRDINLEMEQDEQHQASVDFSGRINRDQRDLTLALNAQVNAGDYPQTLTASIGHLSWQLRGADLPISGISGESSLQAQWQENAKKISFSDLKVTANDSNLQGEGSVVLTDKPEWSLNLRSDKLNLDNLIARTTTAATATAERPQNPQNQARQQRPVIASADDLPDYIGLRGYRADVNFSANQLTWRSMDFSHVLAQATNEHGLLTFSQLNAGLGDGKMSLPGTLDARNDTPVVRFEPKLENIQLGTLLKAFDYPIQVTGLLSLTGDFIGDKIDADSFRRTWDGHANLMIRQSRAEGLNFQQLVQQAVARSTNVRAKDNYDNATQLETFTCAMALDSGMLSLDDMTGQSKLLAITGEGTLDLVREESDVRFNVRVLEGWEGESKLIDMLKTTPIPLRVYGKWSALNYNLQVDQTLRKSLQNEVRSRLQKWADKNQDKQSGKDLRKILEEQ